MTTALVPLAASAHVTGLPALLIILAVPALLVVGVVTVLRFVARRAQRAVRD